MIELPDIVPAGRTHGYGGHPPVTTPEGLGLVCWGHGFDGEWDLKHRIWLWRGWGAGTSIHWVMLNPSTADAFNLDPTIRRCLAFSKLWGYGQLYVSNLHSLRSTDPASLYAQPDPRYLPDLHHEALQARLNDGAIKALHRICDQTIVAWGGHGEFRGRGDQVLHMIGNDRDRLVKHLGMTQGGQPRHPLYLSKFTAPRYLSEK